MVGGSRRARGPRVEREHRDGVAAAVGSFTSVGEAMRLLGIDTLGL